jgi:hypothetical protein
MQHVGVSAAFPAARRAELVQEPAPLVVDPADHPRAEWATAAAHEADRLPAPSRAGTPRRTCRVPIDPVLVCEVGYDHMEGPGSATRRSSSGGARPHPGVVHLRAY